MPLDKESLTVQVGESFKELRATNGWKNLSKWLEAQVQDMTGQSFSAPADSFNQNSHFETVGKVKMVMLMANYINSTIKSAEKIQNKEEGGEKIAY